MFRGIISLVLLLFVSISCSSDDSDSKVKPVDPPTAGERELSTNEDLVQKSGEYLGMLNSQVRDSHGWIETANCDALLFTGLLDAFAGGASLDAAREVIDGRVWWHRRPAKDCFPENSRSTISRDQLVGAMWSWWRNKNLVRAQELLDDILSHNGFLAGEGTPGELLASPNFLSTLALVVQKLGGEMSPVATRWLDFPSFFHQRNDFSDHLSTWLILLRGELKGGLTVGEQAFLAGVAQTSPRHPLFSAAWHRYSDGNLVEVRDLLVHSNHWPNHRLPTTDEHCDGWPIQRLLGDDGWKPCFDQERRKHSGAELVILQRLFFPTPP